MNILCFSINIFFIMRWNKILEINIKLPKYEIKDFTISIENL